MVVSRTHLRDALVRILDYIVDGRGAARALKAVPELAVQ
jgi:hypothetical protein